MSTLPRDVIERWTGRWQYPGIEVALQTGRDDIAARLIAGLARPAATPADAVDQLIADGEFDAAESLAADQEKADQEKVTRAQAAARAEFSRQAAALRKRIEQSAGRVTEPADLLSEATHRRPVAERTLAGWRRAVEKHEEHYRSALHAEADELGRDRVAWRDAVKNCIDDGEYAAARQMLADGPSAEDPPDPSAVPRPPAWPYGDVGLTEVLTWYDDEAHVPVSFVARWRPAAGDASGLRLAAAMNGVHRRVIGETVRELAAAIDAVAGADGVRHAVTEHAGGFTAVLSGVQNPRFNRLGLPAEHQLWVPAEPDAEPPPEMPDVILYGVSAGPDAADRPRLLENDLLRLLAPGSDERPTPVPHRQINLLRLLGSGMPVSRIWPASRIGDQADLLRDDLRWTLDLLGVHHPSSVVDALIYDLSACGDAIGVALRQLVPPPGRRYGMSMTEYSSWRDDESRRADLRFEVAESLSAEPAAAAVFYALAHHLDAADDDGVDAGAIGDILVEVVEPATDAPAVADADLLAACDVGGAAATAERIGLVRRHGPARFRLRPGGLAALFSTPDSGALPGLVRGALEQAYERSRAEERRQARFDKILTDLMHSQKATREWLQAVLKRLEDPELTPKNRAALDQQRDDLLDQLRRDQETGLRGDAPLLLEHRAVGLEEIWRTVRRRALTTSPETVLVDIQPASEPYQLWANPIALEHAFYSILQNAIKVIGDRPGQVQVTTGQVGEHVTIWIKDSGSGIAPDARAALWSPELRRQAGMKGLGLIYARDTMTLLRGTLALQETGPGGTTFVVRLPLYRPAQHALDGAAQPGQLVTI